MIASEHFSKKLLIFEQVYRFEQENRYLLYYLQRHNQLILGGFQAPTGA